MWILLGKSDGFLQFSIFCRNICGGALFRPISAMNKDWKENISFPQFADWASHIKRKHSAWPKNMVVNWRHLRCCAGWAISLHNRQDSSWNVSELILHGSMMWRTLAHATLSTDLKTCVRQAQNAGSRTDLPCQWSLLCTVCLLHFLLSTQILSNWESSRTECFVFKYSLVKEQTEPKIIFLGYSSWLTILDEQTFGTFGFPTQSQTIEKIKNTSYRC